MSAEWRKRLADYKEQLLKAALLTVPLALVSQLNQVLSVRVLGQPWQAIWFLLPVAVGAMFLRRQAIRHHVLRPDRRVLAFLGSYILLFTIASQANVLDVSRELSAFGTPASRRWITPVSWGDWRYRLVKRQPERDQLVVVLLRPGAGRSVLEGRKEIVDLIALAMQQQARGVALDVYFNEPSAIDSLLCQTITSAATVMPVFVGYGFELLGGRVVEHGVPATLEPCLPKERLAHLAGFLDFDLVSRLTPLYFRSDQARPALGLAVARSLAAGSPPAGQSARGLDLPDDGVLRFVAPPPGEPLMVRFEELQARVVDPNLLRGRFVMAGEAEHDSFDTAFGRQPGIVVHSWVAHSLQESHFIRRHSWWLGFAITLVFCYGITVWCVQGASLRRLVLVCLAATAVILGVAVASIVIGPYWFDVVYPLVAVWLLLPLLLGARRAIRRMGRIQSPA